MNKHLILSCVLSFIPVCVTVSAPTVQVPIELLGQETAAGIEHAKRSIQNMQAFAFQKKETAQDQALHQALDQLAQEAQALDTDKDELYTSSTSVQRTQAKLEVILKKMRQHQGVLLKKELPDSTVTQEPSAVEKTKSTLIVEKNQQIERSLEEMDNELKQAKKPTKLEMVQQLFKKSLPRTQTLKKAAFIGTGAVIVGGIINAHSSPIDMNAARPVDMNAARPEIVEESALGPRNYTENSSRKTTSGLKKLFNKIFGIYHKADLSDPETLANVRNIQQNLKAENIQIIEKTVIGNPQAGIIYQASGTLYKPGLYATPYRYFMDIQKALSQQGSFGLIAASTAAKLFGMYHVAGEWIKPLVQKFGAARTACGINENEQQGLTTEKLLEQFGIELTEETKKTLSPDACKAHIHSFFAQRAIPASQANTATLAYLLQIYPIGLINAFLEKSYTAALSQPEKVTSDAITNDILQGMFHIKNPAQATQNKTVAQVAGKLFGQFFFQDKETPLHATTKNMIKIIPGDKQKKPEMKIITGTVVTTADLGKNENQQPAGTEKQLLAEIKTMLAGKVAQENLGTLIKHAAISAQDQEGAFISADEEEKAIHARCTAIIMNQKGLNGQELTAGIQESIAKEVGALKTKLKKEVLNELKLYNAQFDAIFWKLKNNPSLTPDMIVELKKECGQFTTSKSYKRSTAEKNRYERTVRLAHMYKKMMQEAAQADTAA
jgi:hypothetical protein